MGGPGESPKPLGGRGTRFKVGWQERQLVRQMRARSQSMNVWGAAVSRGGLLGLENRGPEMEWSQMEGRPGRS